MSLSTAEKFLLIAHHPDKGKFIIPDVYLRYGIVGALLLDMSLKKIINIENNKLICNDFKSNDDHFDPEIEYLIENSLEPREVKYWINKFSKQSKKLKWNILNSLAEKKIIRIKHRVFLGFISYKKTYLINNDIHNNLVNEITIDILSHRKIHSEMLAILGLIEACKMHRIITSDKEELKSIRKEIKEIIRYSPVTETVDKNIREVNIAINRAATATTTKAV